MPVFKIKKVWDYCTYNKSFFLFVLILFAIVNFIEQLYDNDIYSDVLFFIFIISIIALYGYGLTITRDRANKGVRLPKIMPKEIFSLGIKSFIVMGVYIVIQGVLLTLVCSPFGFPAFDLEEMLFHFQETLHLLYIHDPFETLIFLVLGAIFFFITLFFMEIALARLADTGKLLSSFDLISIKRTIDVVGWRHYAKDCTLIIIAMVILSLIKAYTIPVDFLDYIVDIILGLLIFATQYLGIGAIYSEFKEKTE